MVLARGRGRSRGGVVKPKGRPVPMKPPPLMGRLAPPPPDMIRPRGVPIPPPGLMPRMRPPPPGLRSPRLLPPPPPGPRRPPMPHFIPAPHPPPPPPPPAHAFPPAVPPRPPMPMLRPRPGQRPPPPGLRPIPPLGVGPPAMARLGRGGKRMAAPIPAKPKLKIKKVITPEDAELNKPWITESIKNEVLKKQKLHQKAKKSNSESDWKEFNDQKAKVTTIIREAKLEYIGSHPEEDKYFCETCDRDFKNEAKLAEHMKEHRVCGLDGCQFVAHPKVIEKHVKMQHETGLYYRISNLYKPEDIAKWIAERKRNYPTKTNVEKKQAAFEEKMQRGERLSEDKSRFQRNSLSFTSGFRRGSGHRGKRGGHSRKFPKPQSNESSRGYAVSKDENEGQTFRWKLQPFCGTAVVQTNVAEETSGVEGDEDHHFSDSEWEPSTSVEGGSVSLNSDIQVPVASKALSNLMGLYASEASDTEGDEKEVLMNKARSGVVHKEQVSCESNNVIQNSSSTSLPSTNNVPESKHEDNSDGPPEEAPILHSRDMDNQPEEKKPTVKEHSTQHNQKPQQHRNKFNKPIPPSTQHKNISMRRRKLTLLEKLLRSEIRHERNVILQCVRYVVQNNFLEFGKPKTETNPKYTKLLKCIQHIVKNEFFGTLKQEHRNEV